MRVVHTVFDPRNSPIFNSPFFFLTRCIFLVREFFSKQYHTLPDLPYLRYIMETSHVRTSQVWFLRMTDNLIPFRLTSVGVLLDFRRDMRTHLRYRRNIRGHRHEFTVILNCTHGAFCRVRFLVPLRSHLSIVLLGEIYLM